MMNNKVILSVVITTYERDAYFKQAIESVVSDASDRDDIEVLVLDNNSMNTKIHEIANSYDGVRFIKNDRNLGLFGNWNMAFKVASGDYVYIFGDDDIMLPGFFEAVLSAIRENDTLDIIYTDYLCVNESGRCIERGMPTPTFGKIYKNQAVKHALKYGPSLPTISMCYRKSMFDFEGFDEVNFGSNDWLYLYTRMPWVNGFGINKPLIKYRKHGGGASDKNALICKVSIFLMLLKLNGDKPFYYSWSFFGQMICAVVAYADLVADSTLKDNYYLMSMSRWISENKSITYLILSARRVRKCFKFKVAAK